MNYYEHHLGDYAKDTAHLSIMEHGAYRLLLDRYYGTEAGIPADQVHRVARARSREEKAAVETVLAEFFTLHDGVWINHRAEKEIAKFVQNAPQLQEKRDNEKERQRRARDKRKAMFSMLAENGISMPWNASTADLKTQIDMLPSHASHAPVTTPVTRDRSEELTIPEEKRHTSEKKFIFDEGLENPNSQDANPIESGTYGIRHAPVTAPVTRDNTATHTPVSIHIHTTKSSSNLKSIRANENSHATPPQKSRIGELCIGLRKLGVNSSPGAFMHPDWQPVLERFDNEFILLVVSQRTQSNPGRSFSAAYFLPVLTEIMNSPTKPTNGGLHAERTNMLEQLTGSNSQPDDGRTIDIESRVVG